MFTDANGKIGTRNLKGTSGKLYGNVKMLWVTDSASLITDGITAYTPTVNVETLVQVQDKRKKTIASGCQQLIFDEYRTAAEVTAEVSLSYEVGMVREMNDIARWNVLSAIGSPSAPEIQEMTDLNTRWTWIKAMRDQSNTDEATVDGYGDIPTVEAHSVTWPTLTY